MKKTLIALAVAASAAVSGTSMAAVGEWTPGGEGGSFEMRGTLVVAGADANPWEVKVGDAVTGLDAQIQEGAEIDHCILDKQSVIRRNGRLIAPAAYPIVIAKNVVI